MRRTLVLLLVAVGLGVGLGLISKHRNTPSAAVLPPASSTPAVATTPGWKTYHSGQFNFSFQYPSVWQTQTPLTKGELPKLFSNQTDVSSNDPGTIAVVVDAPSGTTPASCDPKLADARFSARTSAITTNGVKAVQYRLDPASEVTQPQFGAGYYVLHNQRCYDFNLVAGSAAVRDANLSLLDQVWHSLRFN